MQPPGEAPPHLPGHPQLLPGLPNVPYSEHLPSDGPSTHGNSWAGATFPHIDQQFSKGRGLYGTGPPASWVRVHGCWPGPGELKLGFFLFLSHHPWPHHQIVLISRPGKVATPQNVEHRTPCP